MNRILAIAKRELNSYLKTPVGWILLAIFALLSGLIFSLQIQQRYVMIAAELQFILSLFFVLIPIITMRSFAEERKEGTDVLLMTSPATVMEIVIGKYLACVTLFLIMTSITLIHVFITLLFDGVIDMQTLGTYIAFIFTGLAYIAIGIFCSAITESQVTAAIVSAVIFVSFQLLSAIASIAGNLLYSAINRIDQAFDLINPQTEQAIGQGLTNAILWLNPSTRLQNFSRGIFELAPLIFLISYVVFFLYLTSQVIEKRRWSQG